MSRLLGIAAELSAPPSSPSVFRDVSLHAKIRGDYDVVAICGRGEQDVYDVWFRRLGIWDFVDDLMPRERVGPMHVEIEGGPGAKLTAHNLHEVLRLL